MFRKVTIFACRLTHTLKHNIGEVFEVFIKTELRNVYKYVCLYKNEKCCSVKAVASILQVKIIYIFRANFLTYSFSTQFVLETENMAFRFSPD